MEPAPTESTIETRRETGLILVEILTLPCWENGCNPCILLRGSPSKPTLAPVIDRPVHRRGAEMAEAESRLHRVREFDSAPAPKGDHVGKA